MQYLIGIILGLYILYKAKRAKDYNTSIYKSKSDRDGREYGKRAISACRRSKEGYKET